jgi:hypothetical protein
MNWNQYQPIKFLRVEFVWRNRLGLLMYLRSRYRTYAFLWPEPRCFRAGRAAIKAYRETK